MPSSASSCENGELWGKKGSETVWIQFCLSATFILLVCVFISGSVRRRSKLGNLKVLSWMPYSFLFFMIPYVYSQTLNKNNGMGLFLIWAVLVLYIYGSVDNFNALNMDDQILGKVLFFKELVQALSLLPPLISTLSQMMKVEDSVGKSLIVWIPLVLIMLLGMLKVLERIVALMYATCKTQALRSLPLLSANSRNIHNQKNDEDPMGGCGYLVCASGIHDNQTDVIDGVTVGQIWKCELESRLCLTKEQSNQLKDTCLSFSLFWLLLRRYVRSHVHESWHQEEAWELVQNGLLVHEGEHERPFRVVEVELTFLYDLFYSKYFCLYQMGIFWQLKNLLFIGSVVWLLGSLDQSRLFKAEKMCFEQAGSPIVRYMFSWQFTLILLASVMLLELTQCILFITSRWVTVKILCSSARRESCTRSYVIDFCTTKAAQIICSVNLLRPFKNWRSELSQYSLLQSCSHLQFFSRKFLNAINLGTGICVPSRGREEAKSVKLSSEVKKAVIQSLKERGRRLTNGTASLEASELPAPVKTKLIQWATNLETEAHVIIVWHVATTLCKLAADNDPVQPNSSSSSEGNHIEVATSLSKYCAYLVAFAPELLPGPVAVTESTCDMAIEEARTLIEKARMLAVTPENVREFIVCVCGRTDVEVGNDQGKIVEQGVKLARILMKEIADRKQCWEVLAGFWAELILYLAPNSTNEIAHAEKLGDGGEFITILWALLFHAGIVDRNSFIDNNR